MGTDNFSAAAHTAGRTRSRWPSRRRVAWPLLLTLLLCLWSTTALAGGAPINEATDEQVATATEAYLKAKEAFTAKNYEDALAGFRTSYEIVASPNAHYMIVATLSEMDRHLEAFAETDTGIPEAKAAAAHDDKYKQTVADLEKARGELRAKIGMLSISVTVSTSPGDTMEIDGRAISQDQWSSEIPVSAGSHTVSLTGQPDQQVTVAAGGSETVDFAPAAAVEPDVVADEGFFIENRLIIGIATAGVGVVSLGMFGVFGGLALSKQGSLDETCTAAKQCPTDSQGDIDDGKTFQTVANVMLVVGIVTAAAGSALIVWDLMDEPADDEEGDFADLKLRVGPGHVSLGGSF